MLLELGDLTTQALPHQIVRGHVEHGPNLVQCLFGLPDLPVGLLLTALLLPQPLDETSSCGPVLAVTPPLSRSGGREGPSQRPAFPDPGHRVVQEIPIVDQPPVANSRGEGFQPSGQRRSGFVQPYDLQLDFVGVRFRHVLVSVLFFGSRRVAVGFRPCRLAEVLLDPVHTTQPPVVGFRESRGFTQRGFQKLIRVTVRESVGGCVGKEREAVEHELGQVRRQFLQHAGELFEVGISNLVLVPQLAQPGVGERHAARTDVEQQLFRCSGDPHADTGRLAQFRGRRAAPILQGGRTVCLLDVPEQREHQIGRLLQTLPE
ncbi:hypothetical protein [Streptomyces bungoensis]|uniref:hypothetical protein n=1 Tax=Streptomyces bungoensis TaxID=285568 RepID=UPI00341676B0